MRCTSSPDSEPLGHDRSVSQCCTSGHCSPCCHYLLDRTPALGADPWLLGLRLRLRERLHGRLLDSFRPPVHLGVQVCVDVDLVAVHEPLEAGDVAWIVQYLHVHPTHALDRLAALFVRLASAAPTHRLHVKGGDQGVVVLTLRRRQVDAVFDVAALNSAGHAVADPNVVDAALPTSRAAECGGSVPERVDGHHVVRLQQGPHAVPVVRLRLCSHVAYGSRDDRPHRAVGVYAQHHPAVRILVYEHADLVVERVVEVVLGFHRRVLHWAVSRDDVHCQPGESESHSDDAGVLHRRCRHELSQLVSDPYL